uniref:Uncharacterized protein n=1 Tax=Pundamilia nyererei TaxID=303518 RepID=A0A3B4GYL3_9CICH
MFSAVAADSEEPSVSLRTLCPTRWTVRGTAIKAVLSQYDSILTSLQEMAAAGSSVAAVSAPIVLGAVGFTSAGIAAGSYAAIWMSAAAIASGGGVAAGSLFSLLQSAGMAGLSWLAYAVLGIVGGAVGGIVAYLANFI